MVAIFTGLGSGFVRGSTASLGANGILGAGSLGRGGEGISVNAATGNLVVTQQDEFLTGRGLDLAVSRTYNSLADTTDRDNGDKWQMGTVRRVFGLTGTLNTAGSTIKRLSGDGSVVTYTYGTRTPGSGGGAVTAYWATAGDGAHERLVRSGSNWVWTDGDSRVSETYSEYPAGSGEFRIVNQLDTDGIGLSFTYVAGTDLLDKVTTANGDWVQYAWSGNQITRVITGLGATTLSRTWYIYAGGRLSEVRVDLTPGDNVSPDQTQSYWTQYTYDASGRLSRVLQKDGSQIDIAYDASNRVTSLTQVASATPGDVRTTTLAYYAGYTVITGPDGQATRLDYDAANQLTRIIAPPAVAGAAQQIVQFAYDADGNLTAVTGADGKVTTFTYDAQGNVLTSTDPNANAVRRWYDDNNKVTAERSYGAGGVVQYTRYVYDGESHLRYAVSAEGRVTEYRYTADGLLEYTIDYPEHLYTVAHVEGTVLAEATMDAWRNAIADKQSTRITYFNYDARGNQYYLLNYGYATTTGGASTAEGYSRTWTTYDSAGRLLSRSQEGRNAETYVYDGMGRVTISVNTAGGTTSIVFNDAATQTVVTTAGGYTTTQTYNRAGELVSETGSGSFDVGGTRLNKYDKNGRLRVVTDETGFNTYYIYDKVGRLVGEADHYGALTEFRYDAANRVIAEARYYNALSSANLAALANPDTTFELTAATRPAVSAYDFYSWTVYDSAGRVIQKIGGDGGVQAYEYDASNRLIKTTSYATKIAIEVYKTNPPTTAVAVSAVAADTVSRTFYDRDGLLLGSLDSEGYLTEVIYDRAGQKTDEITYATRTNSAYWATGTLDQLRSTAGTAGRRMRYVYDGQGLLRYQVDTAGLVTGFTYNVAGELTETRVYANAIAPADYTYDAVKAAVTTNAADRITTLAYNNSGSVAYKTDPAGTTTYYWYDARGNVTKTQVGSGAGARVTYSYYTAGNLLRFSVDAEGYVTRYDYDAADRKVREVRWDSPISVNDATTIGQVNSLAAGNWVDTRWEYDAAGRIANVYDGEGNRTTYTYWNTGKIYAVYDGAGTVDEAISVFYYDGVGRITHEYRAVGSSEQTLTYFEYDGLGNRTRMVDARGLATVYSYDEAGNLKTETDAAGVVTSYTYNAFGEVETVTKAGVLQSSMVYNSRGQTTQVTDAMGIATTYSYTQFGEVQSVSRAGATTSFQYDKLGRMTRTTDALGYFEAYGYDAFGNRTSVTNKLGGVSTYTFDRRGLMLSETLPVKSFDSNGNASAANITHTYSYDSRGNLKTKIEAAGLAESRTVQYVYDKANRLRQTIGQTFLGMSPVSNVYYDARGNVTSTVDPAGGRSIYYYDDLGRVVVEISPVGTYSTRTYDANGNVISSRVYETQVAVPADGGSKAEAPGAPAGGYRETVMTYDALNRLIKTEVSGVTSGVFNGTSWVAYTGDAAIMRSTYVYDAFGRVVKATDAEGGVVYNYYDAAGRKIAQVDAERYLTIWNHNGDGNVTRETRYANRVGTLNGLVPTESTARQALIDSVGASAADRTTDFTYDLNGNRLSEIRYSVQVHDGSGNYTTTNATISYLYNGLGQVTRKTEASGDQTNYVYDAGARLVTESRASFVDQSGAWVTPTVDYYFDGLGNLSRTRARGSANAAERVTTFGYDGGLLRWTRDAEWQDGDVKDGKMTWYWYDQAGRQTYEYYERYNSSGVLTASFEGLLTAYDAAGRATQKWQATWNGSTWTDVGPRMSTTYNAFGQIATVSVGGVMQQQNQYDAAGRLTATTSGDGAWKYFGYDRNGNQTIAITSAGFNLAGQGFNGALALVGQTDVNASYTRYDKRNMATIITEEGRQFSIGGLAQTLSTSRSYNAFGEVASETNASGATINYTYNTMGRTIRTESPWVEITLENGAKTTVRPTEQYYYDASGRLVASRDANNNLTRQSLLAGTGYGGSQALVTSEIHADGGVKTTRYDIHGDARQQIDELGRSILLTYDKMGRMTQRQEVRNAANAYDDLIEGFAYDGLGQQLKRWNNVFQNPVYGDPYWVEGYYDPYDPYGSYGGYWEYPIIGYAPDYELTDYDIQGRVISARAFGGDVTTTSYVWEAGTGTTGLGTYGAWAITTTMANGRFSVQKKDLFGHVVYKRDLGGNITSYTYDVGARLASTSLGGLTTSYTWLNSGVIGRLTTATPGAGAAYTNWSRDVATYSYDILGNRLTEQFVREQGVYTPGYMIWYNPYEPDWVEESYYEYSTQIKNASATYDALGRMRTWSEAGTYASPAASIANEYDAAGNVRRTLSNYRSLDVYGNASASPITRDYWFRYDSMNRVVINQGSLVNGVITRGVNYSGATSGIGQEITYNLSGQRTAVAVTNAYYDGYGGYTAWEERELYTYDDAGRLIQANTATGGSVYGYYGADPVVPVATGPGTRRATYSYDLLGRQTLQQDYASNGTTVVFSRSAYYDFASRLTSDYTSNLKTDNKTYTSSTSYSYSGAQGYMLGAVVSQSSSNWVSGGSTTYSSTTNSYVWFDGALQSSISYKPNTSQSTTYTTSFYYNSQGQLSSVYISDGKPRSVSFTNDELGQIIRRDESNISGQTGAPHEVWYRFSGRQLGYTGNNGTTDMSMAASIEDRRVVAPSSQGSFRNRQTYGVAYADFAQNYDPINSYSQGSAGGSYTVQRGDTLQSIAQSLWGDSSLWYKIAEANGLSAASGLVEGQRLTLPTGVIKNTNTATTTNPYDPARAMGDLSPTISPKPKKQKCGVFGAILLAVIAVAVSVWVGPAAIAFFQGAFGTVAGAIVGGAVASAAGSIVSQAVGVATGIQEKFSWKAVGLAAIAGGVGAGLGQVGGAFGKFLNADTFVSNMAKAALGSTITQGIAVATKLQDKFSFASVAYAAVASGVTGVVAREGFGVQGGNYSHDLKGYGAQFVSGMAGAVAQSAVRSLAEGTNFGDNLLEALPGVVGSALGTALGHALAGTCFAAGTLIHTTRGLVPIEEIKVGDRVISRDDDFNRPENGSNLVLELYRFSDKTVLEVTFAGSGERMLVTPEHTFAHVSNRWVRASELVPGDRIWTITGAFAEVESVVESPEKTDVFNFAVENHHTYFVGQSGIWVHNDYLYRDGKPVKVERGSVSGRPTREEEFPGGIPSNLNFDDERPGTGTKIQTYNDRRYFLVTLNNGRQELRAVGLYLGRADVSVTNDLNAGGGLSEQATRDLNFIQRVDPNHQISGTPASQVPARALENVNRQRAEALAVAPVTTLPPAPLPSISIAPVQLPVGPVTLDLSPSTAANGTIAGMISGAYRAYPALDINWISTTSPWTNKGGISAPLTNRLQAGGIIVDPNVRPAPAGGITKPGNWNQLPDRWQILGNANNTNGGLAERALAAELGMDPGQRLGNRHPDLTRTSRSILPWNDRTVEVESKLGRYNNSGNAAVEATKDIDRLASRNALRGRFATGGRVLGALGVGFTAYEIGSTYRSEGGFGIRTQTATAGAVGGLAGGWAGAQAGALIGAPFGPVGILVGGVLGGLIGGFAGDNLARSGYQATFGRR